MYLRAKYGLIIFNFLLCFFPGSSLMSMGDTDELSHSPPPKKYKPSSSEQVHFKMGIELELQDIVVNLPNIIMPDHIRIFESLLASDGIPDWYVEADGTGNLEFVSRAFIFQNEEEDIQAHPLYTSLRDMNQLMSHILEEAKISNNNGVPYFCFKVDRGSEFFIGERIVGQWEIKFVDENLTQDEIRRLKKLKEITIDINDPTCLVRPQATFELPMTRLPVFSQYMAKGHPKLTLAVEKLTHLSVTNASEGLWYLVMLYVNFLKDSRVPSESGPKGMLPLMSRVSFSKMYELLDDNQAFDALVGAYEGLDQSLFGAAYSLFYEDKYLSKTDEHVAKDIKSLTIRQWIDSIKKPQITKENREKYRDAWKKVAGDEDTPLAQLTIKQINLGLYDSETDFLSPPPYLHNTYAMGKNDDFENANHAVIEMRGYAARYKNSMRMGSLVEKWLISEIAFAKLNWDVNSSKDTSQAQYFNKLEELNKSRGQAEKDEQTFNYFRSLFNAPLQALTYTCEQKWKIDSEKVKNSVQGLNDMLQENNKDVIKNIFPNKMKWALEHLF